MSKKIKIALFILAVIVIGVVVYELVKIVLPNSNVSLSTVKIHLAIYLPPKVQ